MSRKLLILSLLAVFLFKLGYAYIYSNAITCKYPQLERGSFTVFSGDSFSYIDPIENYINKGEYYFINFQEEKTYAGRVPHYAIPYYLLRLIFDQPVALDIFILFQILFESFAAVLLANLVFKLTRSKHFFWFSLAFSAISYYYLHFSLIPISDSLACSAVFIASYYFYKFYESGYTRNKLWYLSSFFLVYAMILRPFVIFLALAIGLIMLIRFRRDLVFLLKKAMVPVGFAALMLLPWIIRNYARFERFIPLQQDQYAGYGINPQAVKLRSVLNKMGQDGNSIWDNKTAASYFIGDTINSKWSYPGYLKNDSQLISVLEFMRQAYFSNPEQKMMHKDFFQAYKKALRLYRTNYPLRYHIINPAKRLKRFAIHSGAYYFSYSGSKECDLAFMRYIKLLQTIFYYSVLVFGTLGLGLLVMKNSIHWIFFATTLSLIIFFPVIMGWTEIRYFLPFFNFNQLGLLYFAFFTLKKTGIVKTSNVI